ncbi:MAG: RNA pseudouridine synthase [Clostridia bacterium]|nr:RNA pseudouridine synthase [Clostridia bacterium]MDY2900714.1 RNA pseudouridine synthase [Christensenellaceae bacterium]
MAEQMQKDDLIVLYEDNHVIVVLKPQNVPSCEDETKDKDLLTVIKEHVKEKENKQGNVYVGLVHRLDRPTGGVMVYAKSSKAAARLSEQMQNGDFEKKYAAVLAGELKTKRATLTNYLKKNPINNMVYVCPPVTEGAKFAELEYDVLEEKSGLTLALIKLHTGRSHQIRVQMANVGAPVYGDMRYGGEKAKKGKLALWAVSLSFTHPVSKERLCFKIQPPADIIPWKYFDTEKTLSMEL